MNDLPQTLIEAVRYFADEDLCRQLMMRLKWPDGKITCPRCGGESITPVKDRPLLQCNRRECKKQISLTVGTVFEKSKVPLSKWFVAVWYLVNCRNGISSHELGRAIGVGQDTAWFMLHRIRKGMEQQGGDKMDGEIEADETFVGGRAANMHKARREKLVTGRGPEHMTAVQGILQRGGEVRTFVCPKVDGPTLRRNVLRNVDRRATVNTDSASAYDGLSNTFLHRTIDHAVAYALGSVHTNGLENFWSILKRAIKGTYTHVAPFHLHRYATEQAFRHGVRRQTDADRFLALLKGVLGKRLTYRELAAVGDCGFMGIQ